MTQPDDIRLRHLVAAAEKAVSYAAEKSRKDLDTDELLSLALTKLVEMRDRLVHHYFDINLDVLWSTVTEDLPALLEQVPRPDDP